MKKILTVNIGSASKKYALYDGEERLFSAHFEKTESGFAVAYDSESPVPMDESMYNGALSQVIARAKEKHNAEIEAAGMRIVAIGKEFARHAAIDDAYLEKISKEAERDPAHLPMAVAEIRELKRLLPDTPIIAASDSAFHSTMPRAAKQYALPLRFADEDGIERTGFHGLSVASAVSQIEKISGKIPERMIVCHLGSGASITALLNGKSAETSMGYSPLSGIPMSTRPGDLDPEAVLRLAEKNGTESTRRALYGESGLLALSGRSGDMRVLLEAEKNGDEASKFAIDAFAYRIKFFIGAYFGVLGGLDALVFSGTMGIRSAPVRRKVTEGLSHLGITIDASANENAESGSDIAASGNHVRVFVLKTEEEKEIVKAVMGIAV